MNRQTRYCETAPSLRNRATVRDLKLKLDNILFADDATNSENCNVILNKENSVLVRSFVNSLHKLQDICKTSFIYSEIDDCFQTRNAANILNTLCSVTVNTSYTARGLVALSVVFKPNSGNSIDTYDSSIVRFFESCGFKTIRASGEFAITRDEENPMESYKAMVISLKKFVERLTKANASYEATANMSSKDYDVYKGRLPDSNLYILWHFGCCDIKLYKTDRAILYSVPEFTDDKKEVLVATPVDPRKLYRAMYTKLDLNNLYDESYLSDENILKIATALDSNSEDIDAGDIDEYFETVVVPTADSALEDTAATYIEGLGDLLTVLNVFNSAFDEFGLVEPASCSAAIKRDVNIRRAKHLQKHPDQKVLGESRKKNHSMRSL